MTDDETAVLGFLMIYAGGFGLGMVVMLSLADWLSKNRMLWVGPVVILVCMFMNAMD